MSVKPTYDELAQRVRELEREAAEYRRTADELRDSHDLLSALLKAFPMPVFSKDRQGRYNIVNESMAESLNLSPEQISGRTVFECWPTEDALTYHAKDLALMEADGEQVYEYRIRHATRGLRHGIFTKACYHDAAGNVAGLVGTFLDITERKAAEAALQQAHDELEQRVVERTAELMESNDRLLAEIERHQRTRDALQCSEERFRTIFEHAPVMINGYTADGTIELWNRASEHYLGWTRDEVRSWSKPFRHFYPDPEACDRATSAFLRRDDNFGECAPTAKDGSTRIQLWAYFGLPDGLTISVGYDITDRKHAEEEREQLVRDLSRALAEVKTMGGLLPICAHCKKIRDDQGYWNRLESFIEKNSEATFSHGLCPDCSEKLYGNEPWYEKFKSRK